MVVDLTTTNPLLKKMLKFNDVYKLQICIVMSNTLTGFITKVFCQKLTIFLEIPTLEVIF